MFRRADWALRLGAFFDTFEADLKQHGFKRGERDCVFLAMGSLEALTGTNPMPDWLRGYTTRHGALRRMQENGYGGDIETFVSRFAAEAGLQEARHPLLSTTAGDIVLVNRDNLVAFGVRAHGCFITASNTSPNGLVRVTDAIKGWRTPWA
jgi:hypothetical protein